MINFQLNPHEIRYVCWFNPKFRGLNQLTVNPNSKASFSMVKSIEIHYMWMGQNLLIPYF